MSKYPERTDSIIANVGAMSQEEAAELGWSETFWKVAQMLTSPQWTVAQHVVAVLQEHGYQTGCTPALGEADHNVVIAVTTPGDLHERRALTIAVVDAEEGRHLSAVPDVD